MITIVCYSSKEEELSESSSFKYSRKANQEQHESRAHREKRQSNNFPNGRSECSLYLKADQFFYNLIFKNEGKSVSDSCLVIFFGLVLKHSNLFKERCNHA
jgi:hypothetical protein